MERDRRRRNLLRVIVAAGSLSVALVCGEVALWVLGVPAVSSFGFLGIDAESGAFVADEELFWRLDAGSETYHGNAHGLRGPWPAHEKRPRDLRIVCVGDSCTFGSSLRLDQTYGMRLERRLQDELPERVVQTVLLALPGYTTEQSRRLVARHGRELRPDVTVFYVGAWTDYVAAVGRSDAERHAARSRWRLVQVAESAMRATRDVDYAKEFAAGRAPDGRRVALDDFAANLVAMIDAVRAVGSEVVLLLPPVPPETLRDYPIAERYRAVLRSIGGRADVRFLDAQALFESFLAGLPESSRVRDRGKPLLFDDWIHPSSVGHEVLAGALFELLRSLPACRDGAPLAAPAPVVGPPTPRSVPLTMGRPPPVVRCVWPASEAAPERVWLGSRILRDFRVDRGELIMTLPADLVPGRLPLRVATARRVFDAGHAIEIVAPPLEIRVARAAGEVRIEADVAGPPGAAVLLWFARERRSPPLRTRFGDLGLGPVPAPRPGLPVWFERLGFIELRATVGPDGTASIRERVALPAGADVGGMIAQACVVVEGSLGIRGFLTGVEEL